MSTDAWCLLVVVMVLAVAGFGMFELERFLKNSHLDELDQRNAHARLVYHEAGMRWYPHKLANGDVRWYETGYDHAVDVRGAAARG
jgi:NADH:ubiquinone oxidoreductase subunit 3 (subunit A)